MLVKVRVKTQARRETILLVRKNKYEICVKEKPERGEANRRIAELLAYELDVPIKSIRMISGHTSQSKIFEIPEVL